MQERTISLLDLLLSLASQINTVSRQPIYETYDKNVQGNTAFERGMSAASIITPFKDFPELPEAKANTGVAVATAGNPYFSKISPRMGTQLAVLEALTKLLCVRATPLGLTDCLNFGSPEREDSMGQFVDAVEGLADICKALKIPVVSGNVSLYNESAGKAIPPSALISLFGKVEDISHIPLLSFPEEPQTLWYLGSKPTFGGSQVAQILSLEDTTLPPFTIEAFKTFTEQLKTLMPHAPFAAPILRGGLFMALIQASALSEKGFDIQVEDIADLLGEVAFGVVFSLPKSKAALAASVNAVEIGKILPSQEGRIQIATQKAFEGDLTPFITPYKQELRKYVC